MRYLVDTHTFIWLLFDDDKLPVKVKEVIRNPENEIYVSVVTYWEISLKYAIGKLELEGITPDELPNKAKEVGIDIFQLSEKEASSFYKLPREEHKDPFDRLIIWQAIKNDIILISKDDLLSSYEQFGLKHIWK